MHLPKLKARGRHASPMHQGAPLLPPSGSTPRNGPRSGGWRREGWGEIVRPFGAVRPAPAGAFQSVPNAVADCGSLKLVYDGLLLRHFRHLKPPEERDGPGQGV